MSPLREHDVATPAALEAAVESIARTSALAVDVETNAMYAYRWRLCFVQMATDTDLYVVDTLAEGVEPSMLGPVFEDRGVRKVFHDAQGDLRVLARYGLRVHGLFDTHRAATFLGLPKMGLGSLVEERFGVKLAKEHQTADFGLRPLPPELRSYVADDVRYLLPLAESIEREAKEKGIWEELELEFERIAEEATHPEPPPKPKLPAQARDPVGLALAEVVDRLRHEEAAARDVPVGRVLANAALGEIVLRKPRTERELAKIPGVKGSFVRAAGGKVLAEIERICEAGRRGELPPLPSTSTRWDPARKEREEKLKAFRSEAARSRGVTSSVILPTAILERLAGDPPGDREALAAVPWFGEKRLELYGDQLIGLLNE